MKKKVLQDKEINIDIEKKIKEQKLMEENEINLIKDLFDDKNIHIVENQSSIKESITKSNIVNNKQIT
jgi:hypothetical protein